MKYLSYLVLVLLFSCGTGEVRRSLDTATPYRSAGVEQFFLTELPSWANFSASGQCLKTNSFHYLDFSKLMSVYQLKYAQMIELQAQYNERLEDYFRSTAVRFLKPTEETSFFSNTLEQVRGGVRHFKLPPVTEVEVIWLEGFLQQKKVEELKVLASKNRFDEKLPILLSTCHSRQSLNLWLIENGLEQVGFYLLSAEWLNPFGSDGTLKPGLRLEISELIGKEIKVHYFSPTHQLPTELILP